MSHLLLIIIFESVCITKRLVMNVSMATSLRMHVHQLPSVVVYTLCTVAAGLYLQVFVLYRT